jgi:hypothetical protein
MEIANVRAHNVISDDVFFLFSNSIKYHWWLKITSSWILCLYQNKICWFYIFNISFTAGFQNFEKASIHSTNNPHNYVIGSGTWILMCSFSQLFFCIYQLRIGTKSALEFHNHRSVHISVILSNLKIKKNISSEISLWARTLAILKLSRSFETQLWNLLCWKYKINKFYFGTSTKSANLRIHELVIFNQTTKIDTHEEKYFHSTIYNLR